MYVGFLYGPPFPLLMLAALEVKSKFMGFYYLCGGAKKKDTQKFDEFAENLSRFRG